MPNEELSTQRAYAKKQKEKDQLSNTLSDAERKRRRAAFNRVIARSDAEENREASRFRRVFEALTGTNKIGDPLRAVEKKSRPK